MERNQHITLAHINPESFNQIESQCEPNSVCTMWFIGLEFAKTENLNVVLTYDIKSFTDNVSRQALNINMFKEGMKLEARHVKRKQLYQYLSPSLIKRDRKTLEPKKRSSETSSDVTMIKKLKGLDGQAIATNVSMFSGSLARIKRKNISGILIISNSKVCLILKSFNTSARSLDSIIASNFKSKIFQEFLTVRASYSIRSMVVKLFRFLAPLQNRRAFFIKS